MGDTYEPIDLTEEADGEVRGYSRALSLYLCDDDENRLRFWDPATQEYLPTHIEAMEGQAQERFARIQAEDERDRERSTHLEAMEAQAQAIVERDQERSARVEAENRAAEAEAEIARLKR